MKSLSQISTEQNEILMIETNIFEFNGKFIYIFEQVNIYWQNMVKTKCKSTGNYVNDIISQN